MRVNVEKALSLENYNNKNIGKEENLKGMCSAKLNGVVSIKREVMIIGNTIFLYNEISIYIF